MPNAIPLIPPQWILDRIDTELTYDPVSGWITLLVDPVRGTKKRAGDRAGTVCDGGRYRRVTFWRHPNERVYVFEHNVAFYLHEGAWPPLSADHHDRNGTNNKWDNLRLATQRQQQINTLLSSQNTSGYKGICYIPKRQKWWAGIRILGRKSQLFLGYFDTPEEASAAYQAARLKYHDRAFIPDEAAD